MSGSKDFEAFVAALRELMFVLRALSNQLLADLGCTAVERSVLHELGENRRLTVPALAASRAVSRQTMQKTVDRLLDRDWVATHPNPRHQRSPLLGLTAAGRDLLDEIHDRERRLATRTSLPIRGAELRRTTGSLRVLHGYLMARTIPRRSRVSQAAGS